MNATTPIAAFAILAGLGGYARYTIATHIEITEIDVVSKERLMSLSTDSDGRSSSRWTNFVYTADETYVVKDSLWNWHFRAGTAYARIHEGQRCKVTLSGYRWGFLSMYQNIIEAECLP